MTRKIALIGFGAIAREVCAALAGDAQITVSRVLVRPQRCTQVQQMLPDGATAISRLDDLEDETDFVLECAGHEAVHTFGPEVLARGIDFGVISAGVLARPDVLETLQGASRAGSARIVVLPGAIGGIDALAAAGKSLERVTYTSRKPPLSWRGSPAEDAHDLGRIAEATAIFQGTARAAALRFPKNANVVATVALAGIGFDQTSVTLMADPAASGNTHRITASGPLFDLDYSTQGAALADNPKTSALTARSAIRALRHRGMGLVI